MSVSCHRRFLAVAAVLLLASSAFAQESASGVPFAGSPARRPVPLAARAAADLAPAAMLAPAREAAADELLAMMEHNAGGKVPVQNGFARALDPVPVRLGFTELANHFPAHLAKGLADLSPDGDRLVWTAVIQVSEANAMRLHLSEVQLPDGASVLVYSDVNHVLGPFDLGLRDPLGGMWLPAVGGGRATIEVQVPVNALIGGGAVSFTIDKVAELFGNSDAPQPSSASKVRANAAPLPGKIGVNTPPPCLVDGNCVTSSTLSVISDYRYAVAQLQYMKSDGSYLCSGGLVNDADPTSYIPYLLTANHCFSTQTEASSLTAYFDFSTSSCNAAEPCCIWNYPSVSGATLLDSRAVSDFTFVRLNSMPSGYRWLLGWTTAILSDGTTLHRLSHPAPDHYPLAQRYSQTSYESSGGITCSKARPDFLYSVGTIGTTTGGSSGSPVIIDGNGGMIVGQLFGICSTSSFSECNYSTWNNIDGAFATTYGYVSGWVNPTVTINSASTSPGSVAVGSTFTITYNVTASTGTNVLLGASMRPSGTTSWTISDSSHDRFLTLASGSSSVTRQFTVPAATAAGTYDLLVAVWRDANGDGIIDSGDVSLDSLTLLSAETVTAPNQPLTVSKNGTGSGTVTSSPAGISCGATCAASFAYGTTVTLTASPAGGSTFAGWTGACAGTGNCVVTMSAAVSATATFNTIALPNLVPYQPSGWPDKIVLSRTAGTSANASSFPAGSTIYVDWAMSNSGGSATSSLVYIYLLVDGSMYDWWYLNPGFAAGNFATVNDYQIGGLAAGKHTISIFVDATNAEPESNENDNVYTRTIVVGSQGHQDFDGDGKADLVWRNGTGDTWLWLMNANVPTAAAPLGVLANPWTVAATADFDGDGKADIVWRNTSTGDTWMWLMNGATVTDHLPLGNVGTAWNIIAAADFNGDGKADLIWRNPSTGDAWLWTMNGGTTTAFTPLGTVGTAWSLAAAADFDGDGKADLVWRNGSTGDTWMWLMNGASVKSFTPLGTYPAPWSVAAAADFDGDGKADLVWRNGSAGDTWIWLMNGASVSSFNPIGTVAPPWAIVAASDFDGDGKADLIWRNPTTGDTWLWQMNGAQALTHVVVSNPGSAWSLATKP